MRTVWLSFADDGGSLGVCVVDVSEADLVEAARTIEERFPHATATAELVIAATQVARRHGCNPGGEVRCWELKADVELPKFRLLTREQVEAYRPSVH